MRQLSETSSLNSNAYATQLISIFFSSGIGPRGCGKSVIVERLAGILGYTPEPIMLYQDMTARDLLQQRTTLPNGDTVWRRSPLVEAAIQGKMAILDGVHRCVIYVNK